MTGEFITKRPHKKSRAGCTTCKARKIKCDEKRPKCSFCDLRRLDCVYISRPKKSETTVSSNASSPSDVQSLVLSRRSGSTSSSSDDDASEILCSLVPAVHTSSGELTAFDLRLMHHYSVSTWSSLAVGNVPDTNGVLQVRVPQLAFENDFLMDAILGMASLHLQTTSPESNEIRHQTDVYRGKAFSGFRKALNNITPENYDATLIMSLLLVVLVSKDYNTNEDDLHVNYWLNLYRGLRTVIMLKGRFTNIQNTSVGPVFRRNLTELSTMPVVPQILLDMLSAVEPDDPDYPLLKIYCDALDSLGMLFASLQSDGIGAPLSIRVVSWPSWLKEEFVTAADEKRPRALVILSYYLSFTKLVTTLWWVDGIPDRDINVILRIVEPKWLPFLQIPFQVTLMTDPEDVAKLLLRC